MSSDSLRPDGLYERRIAQEASTASDTPRTDALRNALIAASIPVSSALVEHAANLERDLAAARADFAALQHALVGDTGASAILTATALRQRNEVLEEVLQHFYDYGYDRGMCACVLNNAPTQE